MRSARCGARPRVPAGRALGAALLVNIVVWQTVLAAGGTWNASSNLLIDVCPVANIVAAATLWRPLPVLVELTYFWGCAGTIQGVLQPDTCYHFPSYFCFQFYIAHMGPVLAALFLVIGLRLRSCDHAVPRVFAITALYACVVPVPEVAGLPEERWQARSERDSNPRSRLPPIPHFQCGALGQLGDRSAMDCTQASRSGLGSAGILARRRGVRVV